MTTDRAILLTPPGAAAIAVIRISGPGIRQFLESHFSRPLTPNRAVYGELRDGGRVLDDPVIVLSADGQIADINLHGGAWVIESVFQLLAREGFERTKLAFDDLDAATPLEREMLASLPLAKTEAGIRMLLAQPQAWSNLLQGTTTTREIQRITIEGILCDQCLHHMLHPPRVAIVGAPNVGKSTLANQLFAQERVIIADVPGTTRDWVSEIANVDGLPVMLTDTPGLRETDDPIEAKAIKQSRLAVDFAQLIIHVIAPVFDPEPRLIRAPAGAFQAGGRHVITVLNKIDVLRAKDTWPGLYAVHISALTGEGIHELRDTIRRHLGGADLVPERPRWWTARQREILRRAIDDPAALVDL